ncbi:hypothetical protein GURASL_17070 [Geotalea uraniireducens]|uniref:Lipoprotein n=1 Tax=Geotalea uraniireducens TaxID=351604 RepID=A0ABM8EKQ4_9BACT|nr:hypothetical protein [Geotalea uraniireducens]BDV42784.1 hypothetical protein GURASL_17070 [Geotalea uraniireducens]
MRKAIIVLLLLLPIPAFAVDRTNIPHFWTGSVLGIAADTALYHYAGQMGPGERTVTASGIALVPGVINEIVDEFTGDHFGWDDVAADALGAVAGAFAAELVNGQLWISASGRQIRLVGKW